MTNMEMAMIRALAEIDRELGMPDDGCNSTENTITAIRLLHAVHLDDVAEIERLRSILGDIKNYPHKTDEVWRWCDEGLNGPNGKGEPGRTGQSGADGA